MLISNIGKNENQKSSNAKKYVLMGLIGSGVLLLIVIVLLALFAMMKKNEPKALTLNVNGEIKEYSEDTFKFAEDTIYVSIKDIAGLIGYRYYDGEYQKYTQDKTKCYLECDDEVVLFETGNEKIYKTLSGGETKYSEFSLDEPIKEANGKKYIIYTGLMQACNLYIGYNENENQIIIKTLDNLFDTYQKKVIEYGNIDGSELEGIDELFSNKKAILYGMLVVKAKVKGESKYGVISLNGETTYLPLNHDYIEFVEGSQEFIVGVGSRDKKYGINYSDGRAKIAISYDKIEILDNINVVYYVEADGKKGLFNADGKPKIDLIYDKIEVLDSENELYYVEANNKKGVLNSEGEKVIYVEFDEIGINANLFPNENIKNPRLFYDKYIPVKSGNYWGLYDIEGNLIYGFNLEDFGYVENDRMTENNLLLIEDIQGIIAKRNGRYGIITVDEIESGGGVFKVASVFEKISAETKNGETKYYLSFGQNEVYELKAYIGEDEEISNNTQTENDDN